MLFCSFLHAQQNDVKSGALIIAKLEGKIQFLDGQGNPVEEGKIKDGDIYPKIILPLPETLRPRLFFF